MRLLVLIAIAIIMIVVALHIERRLDQIDRALCGFVFYEDGSVAVRTDDEDRYRCMSGKE